MTTLDTNIVYVNARIHAMKSRLFSRAAIEDMLDHNNIEHLIEVLLESSYKTEIAEALTRYQGADAVEDALSRNLTSTRQKLIKMAEGEFEQLARQFFQRSDLLAVKSMLRCRHQGYEGEAAMHYLIPGPTLTPPVQMELARSESMEVLVAGLVAWNHELCACLKLPLKDYLETHDLASLEEALDRGYFVKNAKLLANPDESNGQALCIQSRIEIDRINIRALFQYFESGKDREMLDKRLLPNGRLSVPFVQRMAAAEDLTGAMEFLESTPYRSLIDELYQFLQTHRFTPLERFFDRFIIFQLRQMARRDVFGLSVMMEYGWLKYNEIINLRLVTRGLTGHLPKRRVREELHFIA